MFLFAVLAAPLWYLLIISFYQTPSRGFRGILVPWFSGVLAGMVALAITLSFLSRVPFQMNTAGHFAWVWLRFIGWPMSAVGLPVILVFLFKPTPYSRLRLLAGCFSGVATVYLTWYAVILDPGFEGFYLFFAPVLWLGALGSGAFLSSYVLRIQGWIKYIVLSAFLLLPSLLCFLPIMYNNGQHVFSWFIALVLVFVTSALIYMDSRGRFVQ